MPRFFQIILAPFLFAFILSEYVQAFDFQEVLSGHKTARSEGLVLLVAGDSFAFADPSNSFPVFLEKKLQERFKNYPAKVATSGKSALTSEEAVTEIPRSVRILNPDFVLIMVGLQDMKNTEPGKAPEFWKSPATQKNLQSLHEKLAKQNGLLDFYIQYPGLVQESLSQISPVRGHQNIFTTESFLKSAKTKKADALFKDKSSGLGELTIEGHKLLADLIFTELEPYLQSYFRKHSHLKFDKFQLKIDISASQITHICQDSEHSFYLFTKSSKKDLKKSPNYYVKENPQGIWETQVLESLKAVPKNCGDTHFEMTPDYYGVDSEITGAFSSKKKAGGEERKVLVGLDGSVWVASAKAP
jgi:lysophospholipase L1-like esterase